MTIDAQRGHAGSTAWALFRSIGSASFTGGFSLLEVLLVTSIAVTLAAVSIPVTAGALDELRTSLAAGYLDPLLGGGFSTIAAYLVALVVLWMRPYGLCGTPDIERV